ncbi:hypothetical protein KAR91_05900 [Candidatus Pacearchaeota archaeon]|nr:hypothetical protein [Candidatus Pacearchaeota archaeon]
MTLKTQMTSDLETFFNSDEFAETISYTPKSGDAVDITAIVTYAEPLQEPYVRGEETATCEIEVKASDVESPQYGDIFIFDSATWEFDPVLGVTRKDDNILIIHLERRME